ncbi:MAG: hypothetical protein CMJ46_08935 [Planctomyces sp.]|nr:hypothetical protein [Planctomyces sp.]
MPRFHFLFSIPFVFALSAVMISTSSGQIVLQGPGGVDIVFEAEDGIVVEAASVVEVNEDGGTESGTSESGDAAEDELTQAHNQKKMEAIQQLKFDRRSSAIIKDWSAPQDAEKEETKKEEEEEAAKAESVEEKPITEEAASAEKDQAKETTPRKPAKAERPLSPEAAKEAARQEKQKKLTEEFAQFEKDLKTLQQNVTLGKWDEVIDFFETLSEKEHEALYKQLLSSLRNPERPQGTQFPQFAEKSIITVDDFFALAKLLPAEKNADDDEKTEPTPAELEAMMMQQMMNPQYGPDGQPLPPPKPTGSGLIGQLTGIFRLSIETGHSIQEYLARFREIANKDSDEEKSEKPILTKRQIAKLLANSSHERYLEEFLPSLDEAIAADDREALNLISRYYLSLPKGEEKLEHLENAWKAVQAVLAVGELSQEDKDEALKRAVELTPRVKEELGKAWLTESFNNRPERGKEILSTIGTAVATGLHTQTRNSSFRQKSLELQNTVVNALLKAAPDHAAEWRETLQLMAANWLREADMTQQYDHSTQRNRMMQRDYYGNYYYADDMYLQQQMTRQQPIQAIPTNKILDLIPSEEWRSLIDESLQPQFATVISKLYLKVQEDEDAFPYIEQLAKTHPREAKQLAEEFLRVWTENHNPNSERQRTNMYMFAWGFNQRAQGIPLTRSKQVRNLEELARWIERIEQLPIEPIDEKLITSAFTQVHSAAEVYQLDAIEHIFGKVDSLDPDTLATLIQTMRTNLGEVWRMPATQKEAKTNRKQKDIEREVLQGYATAQTVLTTAMEKYPESWSVQLAKAALDHDANQFQQELHRTTEFTEHRQQSLEGFRKAAELYAAEVVSLEEEKQESTVFETWFYASLGAPDLGKISHDSVADPKQFALIREAIQSLPGELAKTHMDKFANSLFVRLSAISPGMKFAYLEGGFEIVGDHEQAREARKVYDYYNDLVTEIELETEIDGSDIVGHNEPFGLFVNIRHTKEIERESGGFTKYLQNQNSGGYWYYNYGRPLENYRDKFEDATVKALEEHFEILSITFQGEEVNSRATEKYGWRVTPYAYLLLKPKGPEVDTIPSLKMDMDFMDTSGYAVLPIKSAPVPIDAAPEQGDLRPVTKVTVTQTLDEREAKDGKLKLEVRATGVGLVPALDKLIDLKPKDFEIKSIDSEGVAVPQFDKEGLDNAIISEQIWMVSMEARPGLAEHPEEFAFGPPVKDEYETTYQRFVDADLASVDQIIKLEQEYGTPENSWLVPILAAVGLVLVLVIAYKLTSQPAELATAPAYQMPEQVTPFTALGVLRDIERNNGLSEDGKRELGQSINRLEHYYFDKPEGEEPNLNELLHRWLRKST